MGEGAQQLVWEWGDWRALAVAMHPLERPLAKALLVVFDESSPGTATADSQLDGVHPVITGLVAHVRRSGIEGAQLLPAIEDGYAGFVYVPVLHGEPWPLRPVAERLCRPSTILVIPASDALRLGVEPQVLAAWLRGGLTQGGGIVVLAAASELDLATLHTWAGRTSAQRPPERGEQLKTAAKVAGLSTVAALGVAGLAWAERKLAERRAKDRAGLGSFQPHGKTPVSRLAEILLEELPDPRRARLVRDARGRKNRGEELAVVEEWLHGQADLSSVLAGRFAPFELAPLARKHIDLDLHGYDDGREMARQILLGLGFGPTGEQRGLNAALCQVQALEELQRAGELRPRSVSELGPTLERVTKCMLGFHLRLAFESKRSRDLLYGQIVNSLGEGGQQEAPTRVSLDRMSLGQLVHAFENFERWRIAGVERDARERHNALYSGRSPNLSTLRELAALRNSLAHDRPETDPRRIAPQFLERSGRWLKELRDESSGPRLFPALVHVQSVAIEVPGLVIRGIDDEGQIEVIHADRPLPVDSDWYMLPRSNPTRERPLLVSAD